MARATASASARLPGAVSARSTAWGSVVRSSVPLLVVAHGATSPEDGTNVGSSERGERTTITLDSSTL